MKEFIERIFNVKYDTFFKDLADKFLGSTGAEVIAWICLILATFLILRRRVSSLGLIIFLYFIAFILAYIPAIYKVIKGV